MSKLAKTLAVIGVISMLVPSVFAVSNADLQAQLNALLAQLHSLQTQLNQGSSCPSVVFSKDLELGSVGDDVRVLQNFLISSGVGPKARVLEAHGTTRYFGPLTQAALIEYQQSVNISPAIGYFGPITRNYINSLCVTTTQTSDLTISTSTASNGLILLVPTVTTQSASYVLPNAATLNGSIVDEGSSSLTSIGFEYGLTTSYGL
ncbi:MAG: hypothetical protein WC297_00845 [Candidatus Paceibacterota bacterium]|jgi:peptidoglycan hydrolase-like protein with peptidoglycan-binding domain